MDNRILNEVGDILTRYQLEVLPKVLEYIYSSGGLDLYYDISKNGGDLKIITEDNPKTLEIITVPIEGEVAVLLRERKKNTVLKDYNLEI